MNPTDTMVQVRITADGTCFIDDEFFAPPPGASLNEAVLSHLQLEAAAAEAPVRAVIRDEQADYTMAIQVNADGTSQPLQEQQAAPATNSPQPQAAPPVPPDPQAVAAPGDEPLPVNRPYEPLPEPYRARLEGICATALQGSFPLAAAGADQLISELIAQYGPDHLYTLAAGTVRGDIAWLMRDHRYALQVWSYLAKVWHRLLGPTHRTTVRAVNNAVACWRRLPQPDALAKGNEITALLQEVPTPQAEPHLNFIRKRLQRLAAAS